MDENESLDASTPTPSTAPVDEGPLDPPVLPAPPPPRPSRVWRVLTILALLGIVAALGVGGMAASVLANPRRVVEKSMRQKSPTTMSAAGHYEVEISYGGLSSRNDNEISFDYQKPNLLRVEHGTKAKQHVLLVSDGKNLMVDLGDGESVAKAPAPADLEKLADDPAFKQQFEEMAKTTGIDPRQGAKAGAELANCYVGTRKGGTWMRTLHRPLLSVPITADLKSGVSVTAWINPVTQLPYQAAMELSGADLAKIVKSSGADKTNPLLGAGLFDDLSKFHMQVLMTYRMVRTDHAISAGRFAYQPPKTAKVQTAKTLADLPQALMGLPEGLGQPAEEKQLVGERAPDFEAVTLDGEAVKLSSLRGQPVVLDFWATWCPPCRRSLPNLDQLYAANKDRGLKVLAVSTDLGLDEVKKYVAENPIKCRVLWLDQSKDSARAVDKDYGITAIPRTLFIDREGVVRADSTGLHSVDELKANLAKIGLD